MRDVDGHGTGGEGDGGGVGGGGVDAGEMGGDNGSMDDVSIQSMGSDAERESELPAEDAQYREPQTDEEAAGCEGGPAEGAGGEGDGGEESMSAAEAASREENLATDSDRWIRRLAASACFPAPAADAADAAEPAAATRLLPCTLPWGIRSREKEIRCATKGGFSLRGCPRRCSGAKILECVFSAIVSAGSAAGRTFEVGSVSDTRYPRCPRVGTPFPECVRV